MRWSIALALLVAALAWWLLIVESPVPIPATGASRTDPHLAVEAKNGGGDNAHRVAVPVVASSSSTDLVGSVVDESGLPVPDARVAIHAGSSPSLSIEDDVASWAPPKAVHVFASTTTDAQGRFRLSVKPVDMAFVDVVASKVGWRRRGIRGHALTANNPPVTLVLTRGLSISGRTITSGGAPVSGVKVFACSDPRTKASGIRTSITTGWMVPAETGLSDGFSWSEGVSDGDGFFQLGGLPRGDLFLNTLSDRWMATAMPTVSAGAAGVNVIVVPAMRIRIAVESAGDQKVESAGDQKLDYFTGIFQFSSSNPPAFGRPFSFSGNQGVLEIWIGQDWIGQEQASTATDRLLLSLSAPGHQAHRQEHPVEDGVTDLRVRLKPEPGVPVPLVIFDRDGKRVIDLQVDYAAPRDASFRPAIVTEVHGSPHVLLPPGLWQLRVLGRGQFPTAVPLLATVEVIPGRTAEVSANLSGGPTLTIDLRRVEGQEDIKTIEFRSSRGVLRLPRVDAQPGLVVFSSVPEAVWEVLVKPAGRPEISKSIEVSGYDAWLVFP
jgi:hypothetical protein